MENCGYRPHPRLLMATAHEGSWQGSGGAPDCGHRQEREEPSVLRSLGVTLALPDLFPFHLSTPQKCSDWMESFHLQDFTGAFSCLFHSLFCSQSHLLSHSTFHVLLRWCKSKSHVDHMPVCKPCFPPS